MTSKTFPAHTEALPDFLGFAEAQLESRGCSLKTQTAICVALEEVFVNIANYAYNGGQGEAVLQIGYDERTRDVTFRLSDEGVPFDPLKKPDPDVTLTVEERPIGGLGIFIVKKTMDSVTYAYEDGKNILTMIKKI